MKICIDIDGVVNNLPETVIEVYNEDYNDNLTIDAVTKYNIENFVKPEAKENFHKYFTDKRVWKRIKPINVKAVQWLIDNHEVYFVTATECENLYPKQRWLSRTFKNIDLRKRLVRCYDKADLICCDFLIDDCTKNLISGNYIPVCIRYPWNSDFRGVRYYEVAGWIEDEFGVDVNEL